MFRFINDYKYVNIWLQLIEQYTELHGKHDTEIPSLVLLLPMELTYIYTVMGFG